MIGCPGSGKSTYISKHIKDDNTIVVSRDTIRFSLVNENEPYFLKEKEVFKKFTDTINFYLNLNYNVIADATHISVKSRAKLFNALNINKSNTEIIGLVMRTPLNECLRRNELRRGTRAYVPKSAVRRIFYSFEEPSLKEHNHIFNNIINIYPKNNKKER